MQAIGVDNTGGIDNTADIGRAASEISAGSPTGESSSRDIDNKEIIRRLVEAANNYDMAATAALIAPNAIAHMLYDATDTLTGQAIGHEEEFDPDKVEKRVAYDRELYPEQHTRIDQMFDVGADMVLSMSTYTATHKSGRKVSVQGFALDRIEGRKVVENWYPTDRLGYWPRNNIAVMKCKVT